MLFPYGHDADRFRVAREDFMKCSKVSDPQLPRSDGIRTQRFSIPCFDPWLVQKLLLDRSQRR